MSSGSLFKAKRRTTANSNKDNNNVVDLMDDTKSEYGGANNNPSTDPEVDSIDLGGLSIEDKKLFQKATIVNKQLSERKEENKNFAALQKKINEDITNKIIQLQTKLNRTNLQVRAGNSNKVWKLESKNGAKNPVDEKYVGRILHDFFVVKKLQLSSSQDVERFVKIMFSEESRGFKPAGPPKAVLVLDHEIIMEQVIDLNE